MGVNEQWRAWDDVFGAHFREPTAATLRDPTAGEIEAAANQLAALLTRYYHTGGEQLARRAKDEWLRLTEEQIPAGQYRLRMKARLTLRAALDAVGRAE